MRTRLETGRPWSRPAAAVVVASGGIVAGLGGCTANRALNPSFPVDRVEAKGILRQMREHPKPLACPVVVAGGIHDPGIVTSKIARTIRSVTGHDDQVITVSFFGFGINTFDECRDRLV